MQFKIIHNILPLKIYLFKAGISKDDTCPFCNYEKHTIQHLFVDCKVTKIGLNMDGHGWLWMANGWLWLVMAGYGWLWMVMDDIVWPWMAMDGYGWL
jgi:hypothetical protein